MRRSIYAFAWDLFELAREQIVSEFRGIGLNAVTYAGACDMGPVLRLHGRSGRLAFPEDGAVYFRPDFERYQGIKPQVSRFTQERDILAELSQSSRLNASVFLAPLNNRRLGNQHPEFCCVNAFADHYPHCLSPTNQEVRAYAVNLCRDVSERYDIQEIVFEAPSWLPPDPSWRGPSNQTGRNIWLNTMLSLSFADTDIAGAKSAGLDAEALGQRVAARVDQYLSSDVEPSSEMAIEWLIDDFVLDPDMVAYQRWLGQQVNSMFAEIRAEIPRGTKLAIVPKSFDSNALLYAAGRDLTGLAAASDRFEIPFFGDAIDQTAAEIFDLRRRVGQPTGFGAVLKPGRPSVHSRDQLEEAVRTVLALGAESLAFSHFGTLRSRELRWIADVVGALR